MHVITVTSQKGGAGKTTVAIHLATYFAKEKKRRVVLLDLDPQASASTWSDRREEDTPVVISIHAKRIQSELERIGDLGGELVVLDTAPHSDRIALEAMRYANLVLIPTRPAIMDIDAIVNTLELTKLANKQALVILNACPPRGKDAADAAKAISALDVEVSSERLTQRTIFGRALLYGKTAIEAEPDSKAAVELHSLAESITQRLSLIGTQ